MRVVTYNVRGFRDGRHRVAAVVDHLQPDVLLLQETGSRRALRRFASDVGMCAACDPLSPLRRRVKNAVLLAEQWRLLSVELVPYCRSKRWYPRGALVVRAATDDHTLCALSMHFGLDGAERGRHAAALEELITGLEGDVVVAGGDLNATPDMRAPAGSPPRSPTPRPRWGRVAVRSSRRSRRPPGSTTCSSQMILRSRGRRSAGKARRKHPITCRSSST